jgi:hypothetical protein
LNKKCNFKCRIASYYGAYLYFVILKQKLFVFEHQLFGAGIGVDIGQSGDVRICEEESAFGLFHPSFDLFD